MSIEKNIDFEDTVEFVWSWVAQVHSHLGIQGWTYPHEGALKPGISISARNDIANHLFQMIATTNQPDLMAKALTIRLNFLVTIKNNFHLPHTYFSLKEHGKEKRADWDSTAFCHALDEDVEDLLNTFGYCRVLGEKHLVADAASKKKI